MKPFGLLGRKLSHSISPEIHAELCNYEYLLFEKEPQELDGFFEEKNFSGLNVTIPYKKDVIKYCSALSPAAEKIGSVNTITIKKDGTLFGDNSDYFGFSYMIEKSGVQIKDKICLILGTGGASLTVKAVLCDLGAKEVIFVSRSGEVNYQNIYDVCSSAQVIVNATPVGMYPNNGEKVIDISRFKNLCGVFDLIYNPSLTPILYDAKNLNIPYAGGLNMLVAQAHMSAEEFIQNKIPREKIESTVKKIEKSRRNIVLIGMPGSGKSTMANFLGQELKREVFDTDLMTEERCKITIPEMFSKYGEKYFRDEETKSACEAGKKSGVIIATGGGAVLREENRYFLKQNSIIVLLKKDASLLQRDGRPLSKSLEEVKRIEKERKPIYEGFADVTIDVDPDESITGKKILEKLKGEIL